ncbi:MAG: hypothetical protein GEU82_07215 [Luteitalea sp.]|nr:hypothetical protein [Luteitalea sp.]
MPPPDPLPSPLADDLDETEANSQWLGWLPIGYHPVPAFDSAATVLIDRDRHAERMARIVALLEELRVCTEKLREHANTAAERQRKAMEETRIEVAGVGEFGTTKPKP